MNYRLRQSVSLGYIISAAFFFIVAVLVPNMVLADSLKFYTNENYTWASLKSTDQSGAETKLDVKEFDQLYNIYMDKAIFPNLLFDASGQFVKDNSAVKDDFDQHSEVNEYNIYSDLRLNTKPFSSAIGYYKRSDSSTAAGSSLTNIDERYNGLFNWNPGPDLPSLNLNYIKDFSHDGRRILSDVETDLLTLGLKYNPLTNLDLSYSLNNVDSLNKLESSENTITEHIGRINYDDTYFNKRVNVSATYDVAYLNSEATSTRGASVTQIQLFPVHGLSGISDLNNPAQTPAMITLNENPALIDGNTTASAGINLGLNSGLATVPPPPRQEWNVGVDFVTPTQLNALYIWVDKDLTRVSDLFSWNIYTSDDNITWNKKFSVTVPPSGFSTLPLPHFIINFPSALTARFVKVVVKPLDSINQTTILVRGLNPSDFRDIALTEIQPFLIRTSENSTKTTQTQLTQRFNLNGRAKILESRDLFYDLSLFLAKTSPNGRLTAFLSNGLSYDQKFGGIFMVNARAAREDNYLSNGHEVDYQYSAALSATPFATLNDSIIYSGHHATNPTGATATQNSIVLSNTAVLYSGINALLNGGVTFGTNETGQSGTTYQGNAGLTLVPHPTLNMNAYYTITSTSLSGGGRPATSSLSYAATASATYTPVNALNLFASIQLNEASSILRTTTNYGVNFSPFPDGTLLFHFSYNESLGPETGQKSRVISPSLRWNIRPGAYLDITYSIQNSNLVTQKSEAKILSSSLQIAL